MIPGDPKAVGLEQPLKKKKKAEGARKVSSFVPVPLGPDAGKTHMTAFRTGAGESYSPLPR